MTIAEALNVQNRSVSLRDAEVLLMHVCKCSREHLHTHPEQILTPAQALEHEHLLQRREKK